MKCNKWSLKAIGWCCSNIQYWIVLQGSIKWSLCKNLLTYCLRHFLIVSSTKLWNISIGSTTKMRLFFFWEYKVLLLACVTMAHTIVIRQKYIQGRKWLSEVKLKRLSYNCVFNSTFPKCHLPLFPFISH